MRRHFSGRDIGAMTADTVRVEGSATVYRLYDVGYAIALDRAATALGGTTRGRVRPEREEARAIEIRSPPLLVSLGERDVVVSGTTCTATLAAHLFDFGVCSLQLRLPALAGATWDAFAGFGDAVGRAAGIGATLDREMAALHDRVSGAIERPAIAPLHEEYVVFRVDRVAGGAPGMPVPDGISDDQVARLLLGERALSAAARRELMPHRFSYYDDDLAVLTWERALVIEPRGEDHDVEYVLEFANAQLLELRLFDAQLDAELPALYDRVAAARRRRLPPLSRRLRTVLSDLQTRVADITETVERVDNALKLVNDVYLARVYSAALELFRETPWRRGIERKLGILRDAYVMLNGEAQAARNELLELAIVVLIVVEIVLALLRG